MCNRYLIQKTCNQVHKVLKTKSPWKAGKRFEKKKKHINKERAQITRKFMNGF